MTSDEGRRQLPMESTDKSFKLQQMQKQSLMLAEQVLQLTKQNKHLKKAINTGVAPHQLEAIGNFQSDRSMSSLLNNVKTMITIIDRDLQNKRPHSQVQEGARPAKQAKHK